MLLDLDESRDKMLLATTTGDIYKAKKEEKIAIIFGLQISDPLEHSLSLLRIFHRVGVRVVQLTYGERNAIGDGRYERTNAGLSDFGVDVIKEMNKLGMVINLSHAGEATFMDALEFTKSPVIASHANCRSISELKGSRNLSDEQIKALAENGGVMGVVGGIAAFIGGANPTVDNLVVHIDHVVKLVGVDHIGLGLDFCDYVEFEYPLEPEFQKVAKGIEDTTRVPNITKVLVARGYSSQEIEKILGGNFLRVFKRVWRK